MTEPVMRIAVWSPKGGVGKSLLAASLAVKLAAQRPTLLVDGNPDNPDVVGLLQCPGHPNVATWPDEVVPDQVFDGLVSVSQRLWALPGPTRYVEADTLTGSTMESILDSAQVAQLTTVIDLGSPLRDSTMAALDRTDRILIPVTLDLLSIAPMRRIERELDLIRLPRTKFHVVINRHTGTREITVEDVQNALGLPIAAVLPSSKELAAAVNRGQLMRHLQSATPYVRSITELAQRLGGAPEEGGRRRGVSWGGLRIRKGEA